MGSDSLDRCAQPKPSKGSALLARKQARAELDAFEKTEKAKVRKRDRTCRWPGCDCGRLKLRLEVAHVVAKSLGGSSHADNLILLCFIKHQGVPSLHSGDLKIEPRTSAGTNGPCDFYVRTESGRMEIAFSETARGVSVAVGA
jgi:hypothetical protein